MRTGTDIAGTGTNNTDIDTDASCASCIWAVAAIPNDSSTIVVVTWAEWNKQDVVLQ